MIFKEHHCEQCKLSWCFPYHHLLLTPSLPPSIFLSHFPFLFSCRDDVFCIGQAALKTYYSLVFTSQVLGLQAHTTKVHAIIVSSSLPSFPFPAFSFPHLSFSFPSPFPHSLPVCTTLLSYCKKILALEIITHCTVV